MYLVGLVTATIFLIYTNIRNLYLLNLKIFYPFMRIPIVIVSCYLNLIWSIEANLIVYSMYLTKLVVILDKPM